MLAISASTAAQAMRLREAFLSKGFPLFVDSTTNQQFPILPDGAGAAFGRPASL